MALYVLPTPTNEAKELGRIIVSQCEAIADAISDLRRLHRVGAAAYEINLLENFADPAQREAIAKLLADAADPIIAIKRKEVYETLEEATDQCEHVAHVLQGIHAKNV